MSRMRRCSRQSSEDHIHVHRYHPLYALGQGQTFRTQVLPMAILSQSSQHLLPKEICPDN